MQYGNLIITAPAMNASGHSEAGTFSCIVWIATQSNNKNRWANLTAEVESRYVDNPHKSLSPQEWAGGDRMWVIDWMTPFGHSKVFRCAVGAALTGCCFKSLYHRGGDRGLRVMLFRGDHVSLEQAKQWWKYRPILARRATQLQDEVNGTSS